MNDPNAALVARDIWTQDLPDADLPSHAALFVLRMFDGLPEAEAIYNAITARLDRELSQRQGDRRRDEYEAALLAWRQAHPWMEVLADRLWFGRWVWHRNSDMRQPDFTIQAYAFEAPGPSWGLRNFHYAQPTATRIDTGFETLTVSRQGNVIPGPFLSGMPLGTYTSMAAATPEEAEARYIAWLDHPGGLDPSPRSNAGKLLAQWREVYHRSREETERRLTEADRDRQQEHMQMMATLPLTDERFNGVLDPNAPVTYSNTVSLGRRP